MSSAAGAADFGLPAEVAAEGVEAAAGASAFFSGNPNLAARLARVSSGIPRLALSIGPADLVLVSGTVAAGAAFADAVGDFVSEDLVLFLLVGVGLGLKGRPNRSARAFLACCSGVSVDCSLAAAGAAGVSVDPVIGL